MPKNTSSLEETKAPYRVYTLAYVNDIVLIAEKEDEMRNMLHRFLEKKISGKERVGIE